ncbi:MAG: hypothetical protein EON58_09985 [Alphaproteobacteria bacterium]|nr:MAG: hypothetical protein EON58_09985 [Alphaproteobacteria bacterium]
MKSAAAAFLAIFLASSPVVASDFRYKNDTYGTTARFSLEAFPEEIPATPEGAVWESRSGAQIVIYGRENERRETPTSMYRWRASRDDVTYHKGGKEWLVVSGYLKDGRIFYERYIFRGGLIHSVSIRYPVKLRKDYDRLLGPITNSLNGPSG